MLDFLYDNEDSVCGMIYNGTPYFYLKNLQGDIIAIADAQGDVVVRYSYDAWGKCSIEKDTSANGSVASANPFRYRGYYFDDEIGLYYVSSRYYDPEIGRFINADVPEILTVLLLAEHVIVSNLFAYCKNNPVMNFDLLGCASIAAEANWLVNALFGSIMALKLSGAALATKVSAMILAIAPYLFWIVVAVAAVVITYFIAKSAVVSKADSKIRRTVKKNSKTRYWTATVRSNYVDIGRALTYSQAVKEVIAGRSVFTVTWYEAKAVALAAGGSTGKNNKSLYPEIDKGKENTKGYYWHYHTYNRKGGHVYYLF